MNDQTPRPSKKTEMVEVRVSHETKRDFLAACKDAGRSASDVIREGMQAFIDRQGRAPAKAGRPNVLPFPLPRIRKRYLAAGVAAIGLTSFAALPSAAKPDLVSMFRMLDANGDGVLTAGEFSAARKDVKQAEVRQLKRDADGKVARPDGKPMVLILPEDAGGKAVAALRDVRFQDLSGVGATAPGMEERRRLAFANYDADKDNTVSLAEYQAQQMVLLTEGFGRLDRNADGGIDAEEYAVIGSPLLLTPIGSEPAFGVTAKYGPVVSQDSVEGSFTKLDANKDGKLSLQEYLPAK